MSSPQKTSLQDLLGQEQDPRINDPSAQYAEMPGPNITSPNTTSQVDTKPIILQQPSGPGQGISIPEPTGKKDFFTNLKETIDYKSIILVFSIILILSSGIFYSVLRPYVPGAVAPDGKVTLIGSLIAAIVGTIIYVLVKLVGKF